MTYHETALGGWSEPDHVGYGANGYPVRCMCGWGPGTSHEFADHIHSLPLPPR